jgi:hypothetical protein
MLGSFERKSIRIISYPSPLGQPTLNADPAAQYLIANRSGSSRTAIPASALRKCIADPKPGIHDPQARELLEERTIQNGLSFGGGCVSEGIISTILIIMARYCHFYLAEIWHLFYRPLITT